MMNDAKLDEIIQNAKTTKQLDDLRKASVYGFGTNSQRRAAWKLLLQVPPYSPTISPSNHHNDFHQVKLDINRSYLHIKDANIQKEKRASLQNVIMAILERNPDISYYQGLHDVTAVVLAFAKESLASLFVESLAHGHLLPYCQKNLNGLSSVLMFTFPLIREIDPELGNFFSSNEVPETIATPFIMTLFTHCAITKVQSLRILDFLVASHPLMSLYLFVAIILSKKQEFYSGDADTSTAMEVIRNLMVNVDISQMIINSIELFRRFPPTTILQKETGIQLFMECTFLLPTPLFSYPYPDFPSAEKIPAALWDKKLNKTQTPYRLRAAIVSALIFAASIGMRMLDLY